jgi:RHS repeat-associated protein
VPAGSSEFPLPGVNAAKNWLNGSTYDQNGNVTTLNNATLSYDMEHRLSEYTTGSFVENYAYDEANRRVDRWSGTTYDNVYFYGPNGKLLTVVQLNFDPTAPYVTASTLSNRIYFGKMLLGTTNGQVNTDSSLIKDRLGSVQPSYAYGTATGSGEQASPGDDFATYWKDSSTGFEYAMNRYYSMGYGRFLTVDPFGGSASVKDSGSRNRYSYALDDPVNKSDPTGLAVQDCDWTGCAFDALGAAAALSGLGLGAYTNGSITFYGAAAVQAAFLGSPKAVANSARIAAGVSAAEAALDNPDCSGLFNVGGGGPSPSALLQEIASGSDPQAYFTEGFIGQSGPNTFINAQTGVTPWSLQGNEITNTGIGNYGVVVEFNIFPGTPFNTGTVTANATTILHELGHIYELLYGLGSTFLVNDTMENQGSAAQAIAASKYNTLLVQTNCFPGN